MRTKRICYIASPLGFTEAGRHYYQEILIPQLSSRLQLLDPWSLVTAEEYQQAIVAGEADKLAKRIGQRNKEMLDQAQLLIAILDGQEVDSGVAAEIGYATAREIPCLGLRTDLRQAGEAGAIVNLQVEAFILESGGHVVGSLRDLLGAVDTLSLHS